MKPYAIATHPGRANADVRLTPGTITLIQRPSRIGRWASLALALIAAYQLGDYRARRQIRRRLTEQFA